MLPLSSLSSALSFSKKWLENEFQFLSYWCVKNAGNGWEWGLPGWLFMVIYIYIMDHSLIPIIFPSSSHHLPIIFPSSSHHLPIIFPSSSHHLPVKITKKNWCSTWPRIFFSVLPVVASLLRCFVREKSHPHRCLFSTVHWKHRAVESAVWRHDARPLVSKTPKKSECPILTWLVVGPPLWKIWTSIGMIRNPIYGKMKNVPNHQPAMLGL